MEERMNVQDVMTQNPACCTPDTPLQDVARMMVENDCGAIPVVDSIRNMKPVGMITDRDITCRAVAQGLNPLELRAQDCMTRGAVSVEQNASLEDCEEIMKDNQLRRIIAVDEDGRCCGIVTQAHIANYASDLEVAGVLKEISKPTYASEARM